MKYVFSAIALVCSMCVQNGVAQSGAVPVISEEGWVIESDFTVERSDGSALSPVSALIRPEDELIYLGGRDGSSSGVGDLFRLDSEGNSEQLASSTKVSGVGYDAGTGAVFFSEDFPGPITRVDIDPATGAATVQAWVTGFHSGDDDPAGIAAVPLDYKGTLLSPGDMVSTDRGFSGPKMVYTWSPITSDNEILVHDDDGSLANPYDIAVKGEDIAIADGEGGVQLLNDDGSVSALNTIDISFEGVEAVVFDTRSDDLLVLDTALDGVYRVDTKTGASTPMFSQLGISGFNWGGMNIYDDGRIQRIVVSLTAANRVLVFAGPDTVFEDQFEGGL